jgi:hypothetical protein
MDPTQQLKNLGIRTTADISKGRALSADVIKQSDQRILDGYLKRQSTPVDTTFKQAEQQAYDQTYSALKDRPDEIWDDKFASTQFVNNKNFGQIDPHQAGINRALVDLRGVTPQPPPKSEFDSNLDRYAGFIGSVFDKIV